MKHQVPVWVHTDSEVAKNLQRLLNKIASKVVLAMLVWLCWHEILHVCY